MDMHDVRTLLLGNSVQQWLFALLLSMSGWLAFHYLRKLLLRHRAENHFVALARTLLEQTNIVFVSIIALFLGCSLLNLSPKVSTILNKTVIAAIILQFGIWAHYLIIHALKRSVVRAQVESKLAKGAISTIEAIARILLWSLVAILLLGNLGFEIAPLLAGLGIGGVAVALGIQSTLQDMAASMSILIDKPFMVGDFIVVDEYMGTVKRIGVKTTRVESLTGEQIVFSNNDLLNSRVRNYKKMIERRALFTFRIPYDTSHESLREIPSLVETIIRAQKELRFDRAHLKQFGEYAFEFEVVYYVLNSDYRIYMTLQQEINFKMIEEFEKRGLSFAFPKHAIEFNQKEQHSNYRKVGNYF